MNKYTKKEVRRREVNQALYPDLVMAGATAAMARLYASRGVNADSLSPGVSALPPKEEMEGCMQAAELIADAVMAKKRIICLADYV